MNEHEYVFDVKLMTAIRVKAATVIEARAKLRNHVGSASCNFGAWPDGSPILGEASVDDDVLPCSQVDGDDNHPDTDA